MRWYKEKPEEGDFVVIKLTDIDKNSAYADLLEYPDKKGLIHISEASRSWIQDMRDELDDNEKTVAQVVDIDEQNINLSLKRVNDNQKSQVMERWNKEQKAEKFIDQLAEKLDKEKEELYEDVVFPLQKEFGSSFHGFEISVAEEDKLQEKFDEKTVEAIQEVAKENIDLKQEKLEGELEIKFKQGDGIEKIREIFSKEKEGVEIKYMSAPRYSITAWGRTQDLAKKRMDEAVNRLKKQVKEKNGGFQFSRA